MRMLGVDPGAGGALALLVTGRPPTLLVRDIPNGKVQVGAKLQSQLLEASLAALVRELAPDHAYVELVHSMPKQGVASTFQFGLSYGLIRGVLAGLAVPVSLIMPQKWGGLVGLGRGDGASRVRAAQLFPVNAADFGRVRDHDRADAALIALAGYKLESPF